VSNTEQTLQQAITYLDMQRNRALYPMDEQIKIQKQKHLTSFAE